MPGSSRGATAELMSLVGSLGRHVQSLLDLAGIEARQAIIRLLGVLIVVGAIGVFAAAGYLLLLAFLVGIIASAANIHWAWVSLGFAILQLVLALIFIQMFKAVVRQPVFPTTAAELKRDFESLKSIRP
jgi:uncharacterized membrane protein YqjE